MSYVVWLRQASAFAAAWSIVLLAAWLIDQMIGSEALVRSFVLCWLCVGIGVLVTGRGTVPLLRDDGIDLRGAFRFLWRAFLWPRDLCKR